MIIIKLDYKEYKICKIMLNNQIKDIKIEKKIKFKKMLIIK